MGLSLERSPANRLAACLPLPFRPLLPQSLVIPIGTSMKSLGDRAIQDRPSTHTGPRRDTKTGATRLRGVLCPTARLDVGADTGDAEMSRIWNPVKGSQCRTHLPFDSRRLPQSAAARAEGQSKTAGRKAPKDSAPPRNDRRYNWKENNERLAIHGGAVDDSACDPIADRVAA